MVNLLDTLQQIAAMINEMERENEEGQEQDQSQPKRPTLVPEAPVGSIELLMDPAYAEGFSSLLDIYYNHLCFLIAQEYDVLSSSHEWATRTYLIIFDNMRRSVDGLGSLYVADMKAFEDGETSFLDATVKVVTRMLNAARASMTVIKSQIDDENYDPPTDHLRKPSELEGIIYSGGKKAMQAKVSKRDDDNPPTVKSA